MKFLEKSGEKKRAAKLWRRKSFGILICFLVVDDADACHQSLRAKEVKFISSIEDKLWDMREFGIETCGGHRIMIGQTINQKAK